MLQKTTFQGLSQEALQACVESLKNARDGITKRKVGALLLLDVKGNNYSVIYSAWQRMLIVCTGREGEHFTVLPGIASVL